MNCMSVQFRVQDVDKAQNCLGPPRGSIIHRDASRKNKDAIARTAIWKGCADNPGYAVVLSCFSALALSLDILTFTNRRKGKNS